MSAPDLGQAITACRDRILALAATGDAKALVLLAKGLEALQGPVGINLVQDEAAAQVAAIQAAAAVALASLNAAINLPAGTVNGNLTVTGDLAVLGDKITANVATLEVEDNDLILNRGEPGSGITAGTAGIWIYQGPTLPRVGIRYNAASQTLEIGLEGGQFQRLATRPDSPANGGIAVWNAALFRFDVLTVGVALDGALLNRPGEKQQYIQHSVAGALTIDLSAGHIIRIDQSANITALTLSNPPASGDYTVTIRRKKDANATARTFTPPASTRWPAGTVPTWTQTTGAIDKIYLTAHAGETGYDGAAELDIR